MTRIILMIWFGFYSLEKINFNLILVQRNYMISLVSQEKNNYSRKYMKTQE